MASLLGGIAAGAANSLLGGALDFGHQALQQQYTQQNINSYFQGQQGLNSQQHNLVTGEFSKYGLPGYLAYSGGNNDISNRPATVFQLSGSNFFRGGPVGSSQPSLSNNEQALQHWGVPKQFSQATTPGGQGMRNMSTQTTQITNPTRSAASGTNATPNPFRTPMGVGQNARATGQRASSNNQGSFFASVRPQNSNSGFLNSNMTRDLNVNTLGQTIPKFFPGQNS